MALGAYYLAKRWRSSDESKPSSARLTRLALQNRVQEATAKLMADLNQLELSEVRCQCCCCWQWVPLMQDQNGTVLCDELSTALHQCGTADDARLNILREVLHDEQFASFELLQQARTPLACPV